MDQTFLDITDIPDAEIGDTVTLIGHDGSEKIDAFDMEKLTKTPMLSTSAISANAR